ncbi:MAG: uracil phosphoribosyltransferase [Luteibaculaceae bacterium]
MVHNFNDSKSLINHFVAELRDINIQKDRMRFRRNLERIGEIMAYEISKKMSYSNQEIITPLGSADVNLMDNQPVIATVLRAGLPLHQGLLNYFDQAESLFVSAFRYHHKNDNEFEVKVEYLSGPSLENKVVILADPMLATGRSIELVYKALLAKGKPKELHIVAAIASAEGLEFVKQKLPKTTSFWLGAIDDELTVQSYIVPGLGDAGDLAFGAKS